MPTRNETELTADVVVLSIIIEMILRDRYPIKSELADFVEEFQTNIRNSFTGFEDPNNPVAGSIFKDRALVCMEQLATYIIAASSGSVDAQRGIMGFTRR